MYDCVFPSRTARFGTALIPEVCSVSLSQLSFNYDFFVTTCVCQFHRVKNNDAHVLFCCPCLVGLLRLKTSAMAADYRPIDRECDCLVCKNYSRAHLHAKITKVQYSCLVLIVQS
jgi:queuine/archaeosine tRNA-ribosyltransferase